MYVAVKRLAPISGALYSARTRLSDIDTCCLSQFDVSRFARVSHAHVRDASLRRSPRALVRAIERSRCEPAAAGESVRDNGDIEIKRIVRAQANFAEYVPLALLLMGFLEVTRYSIYLLHALGLTLLIARILHGLALSFGRQVPFGRATGAGLTFIVLLIEAVLCLYQGFRGQWLWFQ